MIFSSTVFLFAFLPTVLFLYFIVRPEYRNFVLLIVSLVFYAWGEPKNIFLMILSIVINYFMAILVERATKYKKFFFVLTVIYNLAILYAFKYLNFTVASVNRFLGGNIQIKSIALPIGISFYTFQGMSYVIDVYRGNVSAQKKLLTLALYISMFPQLIAGPIVRYADVESQISDRTISMENIRAGVVRFAVGFSKKILLADRLAEFADIAFAGTYPSILGNWFGIIAYTLQIFYDFSGYSDMAIGLGKIFGFNFLENFNYPYISQSVQEFWRRWHISLSSWFRDYVYIPMGGGRKGKVRTCLNLVIVFFLTGLWHGAGFNFMAWGLFYVFFLIIERVGFAAILKKMPRVFRHIYSVVIILFGWVFFRAESLSAAVSYMQGMFIPAGHDMANFNFIMDKQYLFCICLGIWFSIPHERIKRFFGQNEIGMLFSDMGILLLFVIAICYMVGSGYSPFLYFRF